MIHRLPEFVNSDAPLVRRGRYFTETFLVSVGTRDWLVEIENGRVTAVTDGPHMMRPWRFAIRASEQVWQAFWEPLPRPGYHDLFAMTKSGDATIEGDLQPLMSNLRYVKEVLEAPRGKV